MIKQINPLLETKKHSSAIVTNSKKKQYDILNKKRSILVIDDAESIRFFLKTTLTSEGFTVTDADTCVRGLKKIEKECIDLVVLDLGLPDMDGLEMLETLHDKEPELAVIICTVRDDRETKKKAFSLGAREYITKPFDVDEMLSSISSILDYDPSSKQ